MSICVTLTDNELNNLIAQGWILRNGPFASEIDCLNNCGSSSSSSSCCCEECGCSEAVNATTEFQLNTGTINDGDCTGCNSIDGGHVLTTNEDDLANCLWAVGSISATFDASCIDPSCNSGTVEGAWLLTLGCDEQTVMFRSTVFCDDPPGDTTRTHATYRHVGAWDCTTELALDLVSDDGLCNFQATVTITRV